MTMLSISSSAHTRGSSPNIQFSAENLQGGVEEIMSHIEDIYREQNNSFKLNMNLEFIMKNRKTGELLHTLCQFILVSNTLYNY